MYDAVERLVFIKLFNIRKEVATIGFWCESHANYGFASAWRQKLNDFQFARKQLKFNVIREICFAVNKTSQKVI